MPAKTTAELLAEIQASSANGKPGGTLLENLAQSVLNLEDTIEQQVKGEVDYASNPTIPPSGIKFGVDNLTIKSATKSLQIENSEAERSLVIIQDYDNTGFTAPTAYNAGALQQFPVADVFDQVLTGKQSLAIESQVDSMTVANIIRPASAGELTIISYRGEDETGPQLSNTTFTIQSGDVGNPITILTSNPNITEAGDETFITFEGVDLFGGVQTLPSVAGQTTLYLESSLFLLERKQIAFMDDLPLTYGHRGTATPEAPIVITQSNVPTLIDTYTFTLESDQTIKLDAIIRWQLDNAQSSAVFSFTLDGAEILTSRIEPKDPNNEDYFYIFGQIDLTAGPHTVTCSAEKVGNNAPDLTIFSNGWTRVPVIIEP